MARKHIIPKRQSPAGCWDKTLVGKDCRKKKENGEFSYIDQYQTKIMLQGGGMRKRKMSGKDEGGWEGGREGKRRISAFPSANHLNFHMDKEHYQKRKFHCRPVDNPTAMHQSMKITIRSSVRSFPTSRTILVDSFVWLCCTRGH
jgi:hypothetical protein